jgi:uncharacterized protein YecE (DUF72 family)
MGYPGVNGGYAAVKGPRPSFDVRVITGLSGMPTAATFSEVAGRLHIGTSGFVYKHWKGIFYPEKLPPRRWLEHYAQVFTTCELNTTFYRLPTAEAVDRWRTSSPPRFLWACKGSRFLTHLKRLTEPEEGLQRYFDVVSRLGHKLGPVLWQLPPQMNKADLPRLSAFLELLPRNVRHAFEFRSEAWYTDALCDLLDRHGAALCEHDHLRTQPPRRTGGWRYIRFHGTSGRYHGRYGREALEPWASDLASWRGDQRDAYVYFNNDIGGHALVDALDLLELVQDPVHTAEAVAQLPG